MPDDHLGLARSPRSLGTRPRAKIEKAFGHPHGRRAARPLPAPLRRQGQRQRPRVADRSTSTCTRRGAGGPLAAEDLPGPAHAAAWPTGSRSRCATERDIADADLLRQEEAPGRLAGAGRSPRRTGAVLRQGRPVPRHVAAHQPADQDLRRRARTTRPTGAAALDAMPDLLPIYPADRRGAILAASSDAIALALQTCSTSVPDVLPADGAPRPRTWSTRRQALRLDPPPRQLGAEGGGARSGSGSRRPSSPSRCWPRAGPRLRGARRAAADRARRRAAGRLRRSGCRSS